MLVGRCVEEIKDATREVLLSGVDLRSVRGYVPETEREDGKDE